MLYGTRHAKNNEYHYEKCKCYHGKFPETSLAKQCTPREMLRASYGISHGTHRASYFPCNPMELPMGCIIFPWEIA